MPCYPLSQINGNLHDYYVYEKILNITNHQGNSNKATVKYHFTPIKTYHKVDRNIAKFHLHIEKKIKSHGTSRMIITRVQGEGEMGKILVNGLKEINKQKS